MTHGSLFSGIGGFDLAAEWMGWKNMFHCEWNEFGQKVLKYYWPYAKSYGDIKTTDFRIWRGTIDVLSGGFPCQPYSTAGKRKGTEDDRHLWPEMLRAIREIPPCWVVGENVRGLTNWSGGLVFDQVQADLEAEGYEVLPFLLPACAVNAPHRRERIWFVAANANRLRHRQSEFRKSGCKEKEIKRKEQWEEWNKEVGQRDGRVVRGAFETRITSHAGSERLQVASRREQRKISGQAKTSQGCEFSGTFTKGSGWKYFPTQPPICSGDDGLPTKLDRITIPKWRNESIKGYGNAIVPQVAYQIFKAIENYPTV